MSSTLGQVSQMGACNLKRIFAGLAILEIGLIIMASLYFQNQTNAMTTQIIELQQERDSALHELSATTNQLLKSNADYLRIQTELNKENAKRLKAEKALKTAQDKLTKKTAYTPKAPQPKALKVIHNAQVTWYNDSGTTASGAHTEKGRTIAVDPSVIPLGSWVRLELPDGENLIRHAEDTGGAVHGAIIDVYSDASTQSLLDRGRTHGVKVVILSKS